MKKFWFISLFVFFSLGISAQTLEIFTSSVADTALPAVDIIANPTSVEYGGSSYISWTSTGATSVVASGGSENWTGEKTLSGSFYTSALYNTTNYCLIATNNSGSTISCVTIYVATHLEIPTVTIVGRPVGVGTNISVSINIGSGNLEGFQMVFNRKLTNGEHAKIDPQWFNLGDIFYRYNGDNYNYWQYEQHLNDTSLKVAATGDEINFNSNTELGKLGLYISPKSSNLSEVEPLTFSFSGGKNNWNTVSPIFDVFDIPVKCYGDMDQNGKLNISDAISLKKMLGTIPTDDFVKITSDLDGTGGPVNSWKLRLLLKKLVQEDYVWPIFYNYNNCYDCGNGYGLTTPIITGWRKVGEKWGLFSKDQEPVTNGDLIAKNNISLASTNMMFEKIAEKVYFAGEKGIKVGDPILISDIPVALTGTLNNGRKIIIESSTTDVEEITSVTPTKFVLTQNYPNPFNPSTTISYAIPTSSFVTLKVYDVIGNEIATLVNEEKPAGNYEAKFDASNLASGMYIYRLKTGNFTQTMKMILMK